MKKVLLSGLFSVSLTFPFPFSIQTNPPVQLYSFRCDCSLSECTCKQGEITMSLNLETPEKSRWERYADTRFFMGTVELVCSTDCVNAIAEVSSIRLPYLSVENLLQSLQQASATVKKTMSFTERLNYTLQEKAKESGFIARFIPFLSNEEEKHGLVPTFEETVNTVKEKSRQVSESKSESIKNELTLYLLTQMGRQYFGRKDLRPSDYIYLIDLLSALNREGKLQDFITLWLAGLKSGNILEQKDSITYFAGKLLDDKDLQKSHELYKVKLSVYKKVKDLNIEVFDSGKGKVLLLYKALEKLIEATPEEYKSFMALFYYEDLLWYTKLALIENKKDIELADFVSPVRWYTKPLFRIAGEVGEHFILPTTIRINKGSFEIVKPQQDLKINTKTIPVVYKVDTTIPANKDNLENIYSTYNQVKKESPPNFPAWFLGIGGLVVFLAGFVLWKRKRQ